MFPYFFLLRKVQQQKTLRAYQHYFSFLLLNLKHSLKHFLAFNLHRVTLMFLNVCNYNLDRRVVVYVYTRKMSFHNDNKNDNLTVLKGNKNSVSRQCVQKINYSFRSSKTEKSNKTSL